MFSKSRNSERDLPAGAPFFPALSVKILRPSELVTILLGRFSEPEGGWKEDMTGNAMSSVGTTVRVMVEKRILVYR